MILFYLSVWWPLLAMVAIVVVAAIIFQLKWRYLKPGDTVYVYIHDKRERAVIKRIEGFWIFAEVNGNSWLFTKNEIYF